MTDSSQEAKRAEIVAEARSWVDTRFLHLGRVKGAGVDCIGLVISVARAVGFHVVDTEWYPQRPIYGFFEMAVDSQTLPVTFDAELWRRDPHGYRGELLPGDLMKFSYGRDNQQHIGIVTEVQPHIRFVHAYAIVGKVQETLFEKSWHPRFRGARRFKELA